MWFSQRNDNANGWLSCKRVKERVKETACERDDTYMQTYESHLNINVYAFKVNFHYEIARND